MNMKIGVLGTGSVGDAMATRLVELGHDVMMGSRSATNEKAKAWATKVYGEGRIGTFADCASHAEVLFNCTKGEVSLDVLYSCNQTDLHNKVLIDVSNPLDFSQGFPPSLTVCNTTSLGEQIQTTFPMLRVVKAFNTLTAALMVHPQLLSQPHDLFICGNDADAKTICREIAQSFGWADSNIIDLGNILQARGTEMFLPLWIRLYGAFQTPMFNIHVVR